MPPPRRPLDRRRFMTAGLAAVLAACTGQTGRVPDGTAAQQGSPTLSPTPSASRSSADSPTPTPTPSPTTDPAELAARTPARDDLPTGIVPTRILIPAIGVDAVVVQLDMRADEIEVPDFGLAGWWVQTREPGEIGPSLIGAHVDTKSGPDVFYRLGELRPGDEVTVVDDGGETRSFVVTRDPLQVDKYDRPPEVLAFGEPRPELRLITCGGDFNPAAGSYDSNIVAFCHDQAYEA